MRRLPVSVCGALALGIALSGCLAAASAPTAIGAERPACGRYAAWGIAPGMRLSEVRKRIGGGDATELVQGTLGPQSGVSYSKGDALLYVLYDRDVSKGADGEVVLVRAHGRAGLANPVAFLRSIVPDLGEPVLGVEHLDDEFRDGATVWDDEACGVEVSAYRRDSEWWEPGQGDIFVQILSNRFADAEAAHPSTVTTAAGSADATTSPPPTPPEELSVTFAAVPPRSAPAPPPPASVGAENSEPVRVPASFVAPRYPERARALQIRASVLLRVQVKSDGTVGEVSVLEATRKDMGFEEAAVDAVKQWRYLPATRDGKAEDAFITIRLEFG